MRSGLLAGTGHTDGMERYEEGVRDVDELMAAAMEAIEGDVTDYDMCMDLTRTIQEVFNHAIFK